MWSCDPLRPLCTHQDLDRAARAIAGALQTAGFAGRRALVLSGNGALKLATLCGCVYAGVVAIAVPPRHDVPLTLARLAPAASLLLGSEASLQALQFQMPLELAPACLDWLAVDMVMPGFAAAWRPGGVEAGALAMLECTDPWAEPACMLPVTLAELSADAGVLLRAVESPPPREPAGDVPHYVI
ncbi:MAG: hypothetical protein KF778_07830 [Rhodocyclaceae bacterium]|nr:hypothetical protein [Rhodocyclaceae bacterium]MBX3668299.1 hypothetical protein [Rhodocyclaceae bacterium]